MKLIDNWKESGKLWSIQWALAVVAMNLLASLLPLIEVHGYASVCRAERYCSCVDDHLSCSFSDT
ncbi:DUF7940 domain-containing protein [Vibrio cortegadensis]